MIKDIISDIKTHYEKVNVKTFPYKTFEDIALLGVVSAFSAVVANHPELTSELTEALIEIGKYKHEICNNPS